MTAFDTRLIDYLPPVTAQIKDFKQLCASEQIVFDNAVKACDRVRNEYFIYLSEDYALSEYENMIGLPSTGETEVRRTRILNSLNGIRENIIAYIQNECDNAVKDYSFNSENFVFSIGLWVNKADYMQNVSDILEELVPCNVVIKIALAYNTHGRLSNYTNEELSKLTHEQVTGYKNES
jgi:hypothetical protein